MKPLSHNSADTGRRVQACLAQIRVLPGQPAANTETMLKAIASARAQAAELVVFPEMAIPGYLLGDAWERDAFLRECETCGHQIREASQGLVVVFGNVGLDWHRRNEDGRVRKYNALFVAQDGKFLRSAGAPYDFVITDIHMPDINGLEVIAFMRGSDAHKETPLLIISTEAAARDRDRALALGANGFLSKPFEATALRDAVDRLRAKVG